MLQMEKQSKVDQTFSARRGLFAVARPFTNPSLLRFCNGKSTESDYIATTFLICQSHHLAVAKKSIFLGNRQSGIALT